MLNATPFTPKYFGIGKVWMPKALKALIAELQETDPEMAARITDAITAPEILDNKSNIQDARDRTVGISFDNNLPEPVMVQPGARFFIFPNTKREGIEDADYRISVSVTEAQFDQLMAMKKPVTEEPAAA